jgi:hypothetical protein
MAVIQQYRNWVLDCTPPLVHIPLTGSCMVILVARLMLVLVTVGKLPADIAWLVLGYLFPKGTIMAARVHPTVENYC